VGGTRDLPGSRPLEVDREEKEGLQLVGPFHSDQWGTFTTVWRFEVADGRILRLDVAAAA